MNHFLVVYSDLEILIYSNGRVFTKERPSRLLIVLFQYMRNLLSWMDHLKHSFFFFSLTEITFIQMRYNKNNKNNETVPTEFNWKKCMFYLVALNVYFKSQHTNPHLINIIGLIRSYFKLEKTTTTSRVFDGPWKRNVYLYTTIDQTCWITSLISIRIKIIVYKHRIRYK
jgi:hypothetical protein